MKKMNNKKVNKDLSCSLDNRRLDRGKCSTSDNTFDDTNQFQKIDDIFLDEEINEGIQCIKSAYTLKISSSLDFPQATLDKYLPPMTQKYLIPIVDTVISLYMKQVNKNRSTLPGYKPKFPISKFTVDLSILDPKLARDIISKQGKINYQWYGFTYEWYDPWTGVRMTGKTSRPNPLRYWDYIHKAIFVDRNTTSLADKSKNHFYQSQNFNLHSLHIRKELGLTKNILKQIKFGGLIFHHLIFKKILKKTATGEIDFDSIEYSAVKRALNDRFQFNFLDLTFSNKALAKSEIDRILKQRRIGVALNRDTKSLGLESFYNIIIDKIIRLVAIGMNTKQISNFLIKQGYNIDYDFINVFFSNVFGGIKNARIKFFYPVLDLFFNLDKFKHYLEKIYDYFERGYSTNKISILLHLDEIFSDSSEVVRPIIIKKYFPLYNKSKSFTELRYAVLRDLFMDEIEKNVRKGVVNYKILLKRFDGFKDYLGCETNEISTFFHKNFKKSLSQLIIDKYGDIGLELIKENKTKKGVVQYYKNKLSNKAILYEKALKLIRKNIFENKISNYSRIQLCKDLKFDKDFGYSTKSLKAICTKLIKRHIGISFEELVLEALNLRDKAITLIKEHINEISKTNRSPIYTMVDFFKDLDIYSILPTTRLDIHLDRYIRKFVGFSSWQNLLTFVKKKFYPDQTFDWEIDLNYFLTFYNKNRNKPTKFYMDFFLKFPSISKRTIYRWLAKCKISC